MALAQPNRFGYSPLPARPQFTWPGGARLAVYIAVCIEHFSYNEGGLGLSYSPAIPHPNTYNWAWREYGNRVGGWRMLDALQAVDIRPTALVNSECYEHCPELLDAYRKAGTEFVGHGRTNSETPNGMTPDEERALVDTVRQTIERHEGRPPAGWMSPGANPSRITEDLLAEHGFRYTLDWPLDEQPVWMATAGGPLLSVPYPQEVNDVPMIAFHHGSAAEFADMVTDGFDELKEQSRHASLVFGVVVHTFIAGQPHRLRRFRTALQHMRDHSDGVWFSTPGDIAEYYATSVEPPPQSSVAFPVGG